MQRQAFDTLEFAQLKAVLLQRIRTPLGIELAEGLPVLTDADEITRELRRTSEGVTYLRELWHAYQTQEVSGSDVLLLLSQRPMNPGTSARSPMSSGPQAPAADQPAAEPAPVEPVTQPAAPEHE